MDCKLFTYWSFSRPTLWLSMWSVFKSILYIFEKKVYFSNSMLVSYNEFVKHVAQILCILTHVLFISFCNFRKRLVDFTISPDSSIHFHFTYFKTMVLSATGLELLSEQLNTLSLSSDPVYPPKTFCLS